MDRRIIHFQLHFCTCFRPTFLKNPRFRFLLNYSPPYAIPNFLILNLSFNYSWRYDFHVFRNSEICDFKVWYLTTGSLMQGLGVSQSIWAFSTPDFRGPMQSCSVAFEARAAHHQTPGSEWNRQFQVSRARTCETVSMCQKYQCASLHNKLR